jgi:hypothetical protein
MLKKQDRIFNKKGPSFSRKRERILAPRKAEFFLDYQGEMPLWAFGF